jgi:glycosyltransferase involved in cell wall biosynthesis
VTPIGVLHLVDTLWAGGAERVAVDLVNHLPRDGYAPSLCTTRRDGPLEALVAADVGRLRLARTRRFDGPALQRLIEFIREHGVRILHAHGPSLLIARAASLAWPRPSVVWHVHAGAYATGDPSALPYRLLAAGVDAVIAVSEPLARWARRCLPVPDRRVWYVPNLVSGARSAAAADALPGSRGARLVSVGNLRPEKGQLTLVRAMPFVLERRADAHLLLVGGVLDAAYAEAVRGEITRLGLEGQVTLLGQRLDVPAVLAACDVGVLSSEAEGLPLALVEYGCAGLPVVATGVGQCADVLENGGAGVVVPPGDVRALAAGITQLLECPALRGRYADRFRERVERTYSSGAVMRQIAEVYDDCVRRKHGAPGRRPVAPRREAAT